MVNRAEARLFPFRVLNDCFALVLWVTVMLLIQSKSCREVTTAPALLMPQCLGFQLLEADMPPRRGTRQMPDSNSSRGPESPPVSKPAFFRSSPLHLGVKQVLTDSHSGLPPDLVIIILGYVPIEFVPSGDWDANGLFYAIGSRFGSCPWRNPARKGVITILRASTPCPPRKNLPGSALAAHGPRLSGAIWSCHHDVGVDLGAGVLFQLTTFTVLSRAGLHLQADNWWCSASVDQTKWVTCAVGARSDAKGNELSVPCTSNPGFNTSTFALSVVRPTHYRYFRLQYRALYPLSLRAIELYGSVCYS
jgi:hypothetical protein